MIIIQDLADLKSKFVTQEVGQELVLVPLTGNVATMTELFNLNETGRFIWEHLDETATVESLLEAMLQEYEIDSDTARADIERFLDRLTQLLNANR